MYRGAKASSAVVDAIAVVDLATNNSLLQSLQNIPREVLAVLDTTAYSDKIVKDTSGLPLLLRDSGVCHAAWHLDQGFNAAQGLSEGENLSGLAEALGSLLAAVYAEREHTATHAVTVLLSGDVVLWMRGETRVVDGDDVRRS